MRQVVADHHHGQALVAHFPHQLEHLARLLHAQRRGRLVQDDDARVEVDRARDADALALAAGERAHLLAQVGDADLEAAEQPARFLVHAAQVHERREQAFAQELPAEKDVGRDVEVVGKRQVLVDGLDAERLGVPRLADGN